MDIVERLKKHARPTTPYHTCTNVPHTDLHEAAAEIERLRAERAWRPIAEAPHNVVVLLSSEPTATDPTGMEVGCASWGWTGRAVSNISRHGTATHWQPLPPAPEAE